MDFPVVFNTTRLYILVVLKHVFKRSSLSPFSVDLLMDLVCVDDAVMDRRTITPMVLFRLGHGSIWHRALTEDDIIWWVLWQNDMWKSSMVHGCTCMDMFHDVGGTRVHVYGCEVGGCVLMVA